MTAPTGRRDPMARVRRVAPSERPSLEQVRAEREAAKKPYRSRTSAKQRTEEDI